MRMVSISRWQCPGGGVHRRCGGTFDYTHDLSNDGLRVWDANLVFGLCYSVLHHSNLGRNAWQRRPSLKAFIGS